MQEGLGCEGRKEMRHPTHRRFVPSHPWVFTPQSVHFVYLGFGQICLVPGLAVDQDNMLARHDRVTTCYNVDVTVHTIQAWCLTA